MIRWTLAILILVFVIVPYHFPSVKICTICEGSRVVEFKPSIRDFFPNAKLGPQPCFYCAGKGWHVPE